MPQTQNGKEDAGRDFVFRYKARITLPVVDAVGADYWVQGLRPAALPNWEPRFSDIFFF